MEPKLDSMAGVRLTAEQIAGQVGREGLDYFRLIVDSFRRDPRDKAPDADAYEFEGRLAPSVILRGEMLLFCQDLPRFAVRMYLDRSQDSFINLRRMKEISSHLIGAPWSMHDGSDIVIHDDYGEQRYAVKANADTPHKLFEELAFCSIADCALVPPPHLTNVFRFCTADLGWAYGEGRSIRAVPFVYPLRGFSGAACAQACAFMTASLLHDHPVYRIPDPASIGVHGLLEITAITTPEDQPWLRLKGLKPNVLARYFQKTGRSTFLHLFLDTDGTLAGQECVIALKTYVSSGFPVILPVCKGSNASTGEDRDHNHAVVVLGIASTKGKEPCDWVFCVNDPGEGPFRRLSSGDIISQSVVAVDVDGKQERSTNFLCVLPNEIVVPFNTAKMLDANDQPAYRLGIEEIAKGAQFDWLHARSPAAAQPLPAMVKYEAGDFQLHQMKLSVDDKLVLPRAPRAFPLLKDNQLRTLWESDPELRKLAGRWCWLQYRKETAGEEEAVWIWDAQKETISISTATWAYPDPEGTQRVCLSYLLGRLVRPRGGHAWKYEVCRKAIEDPFPLSKRFVTQPPAILAPVVDSSVSGKMPLTPGPASANTSAPLLQASLITSFSPLGLSHALSHWPQGVKKAEFYALMQMDDELLKGLRPLSPLPGQAHFSATHILAKLFEDGQPFKRLGILADRVAAQFNSRGVKVEALASFIPHLASLERSSREEAQNAVRCLWVLAKLLRDREHHIRSIELVAGSRLVGIISTVRRTPAVPARGIVISPDEHTILFAQRLRPELSCIRLLSALEESLTDICNEYPLPDVALSLECEPGPLFTANGTRALRQVVEAIDQYPALKNRLGFNVDIAHFALAGIHPSDLFSSGDIAQRISHFHISDHGWGHFGDAVIGHCGLLRGEADRLEVFKDWLRCACAYAKTRTGPTTGLVPFSGLVSVELEAAKSTELVRRSCEVLTELLAQAAGWHDPKPPL